MRDNHLRYESEKMKETLITEDGEIFEAVISENNGGKTVTVDTGKRPDVEPTITQLHDIVERTAVRAADRLIGKVEQAFQRLAPISEAAEARTLVERMRQSGFNSITYRRVGEIEKVEFNYVEEA